MILLPNRLMLYNFQKSWNIFWLFIFFQCNTFRQKKGLLLRRTTSSKRPVGNCSRPRRLVGRYTDLLLVRMPFFRRLISISKVGFYPKTSNLSPLENIQTGRDISPRRFVDTELPRIEERPAVPPHREAEVAWEDVPRKYEDERRQVDEEVQFMHRQIENQMSGLHPVPHMQKPESSPVLSTGRDETWDSVATGSDFVFQPQAPLRRSLELPEGLNQPDLDAYVPTQQQQEVFHRPPLQVDTHVRPSGSPKLSPKMSPQRKLSGE